MPLFIPNDFRDGSEIIRFGSVSELVAVLEQIVADKIDWRLLAAQSEQRLRRYHTTERRAAMTLSNLNTAFLK